MPVDKGQDQHMHICPHTLLDCQPTLVLVRVMSCVTMICAIGTS